MVSAAVCLFSKESLHYLGVDAAAGRSLLALPTSVKLYDCKVKHMKVVRRLSYYDFILYNSFVNCYQSANTSR